MLPTNPDGKHWGVGPTGYSLRTTVPSKVTELSPTKALVERTGPDETVWVPDPRPVPDALTDTYQAEPYSAELPHEHEHITGWANFMELIGPEGVKALARSVL